MGLITRVFEFDSAHRVCNEKVKCFNLHGHRFKVEATFYYENKLALGYAVDFKEVKRICGGFLDEFFDHACLLNPEDTELIELCKKNNWRLWLMGLGNGGDINPSAENLASELWTIFSHFFTKEDHGVSLARLTLYETPNCWVDALGEDYEATEETLKKLQDWRGALGTINYDIRNV